MSLLLSSPGAPLEPAGPHRKGELVAAVAKLTLGIELGMSNVDPSNVFGDVSAVVQAAGGLILGALVRKLDSVNLYNAILIATPKSLPAVDLPFRVRQGQDAGIAECLGCTKPRYCLVLFNTHSAVFTIKEFSSKAHLETAYASAFQAVLNADARFGEAHKSLKGPATENFNTAYFLRTPTGTYRNHRKVTLQQTVLTFNEMQSFSSVGMLKQKYFHDKSHALNGKTGSWEKLLKVAHIGHKKGPEPELIASSIADFIGLWASATGDIRTIGQASCGIIAPAARGLLISTSVINSWKGFCTCASARPDNRTIVKWRFDAVGEWQ